MPFHAALSTSTQTARAVEESCAAIRAAITGPPDLVCVFFAPHHLEFVREIGGIFDALQPRALIGCVGEGIICNDREIEHAPALAIWAGQWSKPVDISTFHLDLEQTSDGHSLLGWPDDILQAHTEQSSLLVLGDPRTFPSDVFLQQINDDFPGLRVLGGMASGAGHIGDCRLLLNDRIVHSGAVGILLQGDLRLRSIVSQGCRPIGKHMVITKGRENVIEELGGQPALTQLQQLWQTLSQKERHMVQQGLHIGLVINEYQGDFQRGDFLVRNVMGLDRNTGSIGITDRVRVGQTVQFHIRDAETADEDLHAMLQIDLSANEKRPDAALVFSCNGRGSRLFADADHDARTIRAEAGNIPLAGFFAAGELGPVGGKNFIHGFTASVALFEE
jgi:small ligand-binding sensory domain FIST